MPGPGWTPSIVPDGSDQDVYLVADDLGRLGGVWAEAAIKRTDLEAVIQDLLAGQFKSPIRVVAFNTAEEWSRDVSADVAQELRRRCDQQQRAFRSSCRISSIATKAATAIFNCRCRSDWFDHAAKRTGPRSQSETTI